MWSDLRVEIQQAQQALHIPAQDFAPLPITTHWGQLEERIYHTFCQLKHPTARPRWLWEHFKAGAYGVVCEDDPLAFLTSLLEEEELVWLMLNETVNSVDKFWFYQGKRHAIHQVLAACYFLDEVYLISKKYDWLASLDHHHVVSGIGSPIREKLMARAAQPIT